LEGGHHYVVYYPGIRPEVLKKSAKNYGKIKVWKEATMDDVIYYPGIRPEVLKQTAKNNGIRLRLGR
jgi:hypothetical protein